MNVKRIIRKITGAGRPGYMRTWISSHQGKRIGIGWYISRRGRHNHHRDRRRLFPIKVSRYGGMVNYIGLQWQVSVVITRRKPQESPK